VLAIVIPLPISKIVGSDPGAFANRGNDGGSGQGVFPSVSWQILESAGLVDRTYDIVLAAGWASEGSAVERVRGDIFSGSIFADRAVHLRTPRFSRAYDQSIGSLIVPQALHSYN
jgi:hypothetical protein